MKERIEALLAEVENLKLRTAQEIEDARVRLLGKKGEITALFDEFRNVDKDRKREFGQQLNRLKTGMMISGAVELGCVAAKMNAGMRSQALTYADGIGRAFQIRDDMLDVVGDAAVFGKPIGSDREEGKVTFVDVLGLDGCAREVERCTEAAKSAVANWSDHMFLWELADRMVGRTK